MNSQLKTNNMEKLRVFLCHASENKPIVKRLFDRLAKAGFDPWLDSEILLPGMDWDLEIKKGLRSCDAVILCLSAVSVAKEGYLQKELKFAQDIEDEKPRGTIFLIPLRLEKCPTPFELQRIQWGDYSAPDGFDKLVKALSTRAQQLGKIVGMAHSPSLDDNVSSPFTPLYERSDTVQLILDGEFADCTETRQSEILTILAALLHVEKSRIRISKVLSGSIILELKLPTDFINQLVSLIQERNSQLLELRVLGLRLSNGEYISIEPLVDNLHDDVTFAKITDDFLATGDDKNVEKPDVRSYIRTKRTRNEIRLLVKQIDNPFIRYLERKLRMENAHWIRTGMTVPAQGLNFTAIYFEGQTEIFNNIRIELDSVCDKLAEDRINLAQDTFMDFMNSILKQITIRVQQVEDLLGPTNRQYDLGISLEKAATVVHDDVNSVEQSLNMVAMTLLSQSSEYELLSDHLRTELTDLAISLEEFQKYLSQTYSNAIKEKVFSASDPKI